MYTDEREYLEGYVTTLKGNRYEGIDPENKAEPVINKMKFSTENVKNLINPLDDDNLKEIDRLTITKYYPPDAKNKKSSI